MTKRPTGIRAPKLKPLVLTRADLLTLEIWRDAGSLMPKSHPGVGAGGGAGAKDFWKRKYGVDKKTPFSAYTDGKIPVPDDWVIPEAGKLTPGEHCMLLRKRRGWTAKHIAELIGVGTIAISEMERAKYSPARLYAFWEANDE
jgi:hypothetical protein